MSKGKSSKKGKVGHLNFEKNKARRSEKQERYLNDQQSMKQLRERLLVDVKAKFAHNSPHMLRKQFGTLNINRMSDILNDSWISSDWFKNREALKLAKIAESVRILNEKKDKPPSHKFQKSDRKNSNNQRNQVQEVPDGSTIGTGQAQVD